MPRAKLGQHFLIDNSIARRIVDAVPIQAGDLIVEVGPGHGALTRHLVSTAAGVGARIVLVELDDYLASLLTARYARSDAVTVVHGDARDLKMAELLGGYDVNGYKVLGNLPYYAGTPIVRRFLESDTRPESMVVMLQREVALDMVASPGQMSLLSLAVQIYASGQVLFTVEPSAFDPPPKVRSAVIGIAPRRAPLVAPPVLDALFEVARVCFRGKRKQLHNSMANGLRLNVDQCKDLGREAGIDTTRRPATLSLDEWESLAVAWMRFAEIRREC